MITVSSIAHHREVPCPYEVDCGWVHRELTGRYSYRLWFLPIPKRVHDWILRWMARRNGVTE